MKARLYRHIMRLSIRIGQKNIHAAITTVAFRWIEKIPVDKQALTARSFHRVLRVARTISNLARSEQIDRPHLAEALAYRAMPLLA